MNSYIIFFTRDKQNRTVKQMTPRLGILKLYHFLSLYFVFTL